MGPMAIDPIVAPTGDFNWVLYCYTAHRLLIDQGSHVLYTILIWNRFKISIRCLCVSQILLTTIMLSKIKRTKSFQTRNSHKTLKFKWRINKEINKFKSSGNVGCRYGSGWLYVHIEDGWRGCAEGRGGGRPTGGRGRAHTAPPPARRNGRDSSPVRRQKCHNNGPWIVFAAPLQILEPYTWRHVGRLPFIEKFVSFVEKSICLGVWNPVCAISNTW